MAKEHAKVFLSLPDAPAMPFHPLDKLSNADSNPRLGRRRPAMQVKQTLRHPPFLKAA